MDSLSIEATWKPAAGWSLLLAPLLTVVLNLTEISLPPRIWRETLQGYGWRARWGTSFAFQSGGVSHGLPWGQTTSLRGEFSSWQFPVILPPCFLPNCCHATPVSSQETLSSCCQCHHSALPAKRNAVCIPKISGKTGGSLWGAYWVFYK